MLHEEIKFEISEIFIWDTASPFVNILTSAEMLNPFYQYERGIQR